MKSFRILRGYKTAQPLQPALVVELSLLDMTKMLKGEEILLSNKSTEIIVLRNATAYEAFNLGAPKAED